MVDIYILLLMQTEYWKHIKINKVEKTVFSASKLHPNKHCCNLFFEIFKLFFEHFACFSFYFYITQLRDERQLPGR